MNRDRISRLAHARHPIAAPLSDGSVDDVLRHALARGPGRALDLGCGGGEWLIRAAGLAPSLEAVGVDLSQEAVAHGRAEAARRGVAGQVRLHTGDAAGFGSPQPFGLVLCVGSTHAFGGLAPALAAAGRHLAPGGTVVIGDGYWSAPPPVEAVEALGELDGLAGTVASVTAAGWTPVHGHLSTRAELDAYEWAWTGSLAGWGLEHAGTDDGAQALAVSAGHLDGWLRGYRDCFGFATLVLRRTTG
ncbi:class I SAM-dependent methyltransferase [Kineosporia sp. J2-2]|uniref:Class I SAM-dependent methyltransferase n=1 Tax=Kineosporia corallincola TaxID=2835133 RepID=A0ABS5TKU3_9ACTN|nr:class I SAM-dependent methyltransferase [Kineosporia corallincola]MBT0771712.1 class I SAM-dependent methyltransferase [Kineosporia corallincola]